MMNRPASIYIITLQTRLEAEQVTTTSSMDVDNSDYLVSKGSIQWKPTQKDRKFLVN